MRNLTLRSVEDTARWVAFHRATETEAPDALFRDPHARRLAGARGEEIGKCLKENFLFIAMRTWIFDTLIRRHAARYPTGMVLNLGSGLDTRPFRLDFPRTLRWVEVDLPDIIGSKKTAMAREVPNCHLEMIPADLSAASARHDLFRRLNAESSNVLVICEGLLTYLSDQEVAGLAAELLAFPAFKSWMVEIVSPETVAFVRRSWGNILAEAGCTMRFAPADWRRFYAAAGWRVAEFRDIEHEAVRVGRAPAHPGLRPRLGRVARKYAHASATLAKWASRRESGVAVLRPR